MAINPNEINIKNIIELIQSSSIQDNDLLVIGQGIYARKSTVLELYNKFGVPSILTSLNSLQLQINQLNNTLGNSVLYSPQVKTPIQKFNARNNLEVYSRFETQTIVNSAIANLGNVVNSVNGVNVDNTDPKNPIVAEFRPIADYQNDMLLKADIDGNLTIGGIWWQDQVLSDRFANYKQVWTALTNNTIEWGNIELDKHIFLADDADGLKIKVGSTEGTIWNTFNLTNVSQLNNDAGYLQANDLDGFIYDVQYNSATHTITFYLQNEPNIVIDLPIEQLIKGVQLVGDDLVFTFEDGSTVTVPLNTLLVGVVKSVNGLTPNSQGEIILNISDIPGLTSELNQIGALSTLTTTNKNNLVDAINEVNGKTSKRVSTTISQGADWYRIARGSYSGGSGTSFIIIIERNFGNTNNESYTFSINTAYNGKTTITQLSGTYNDRILTKIRVVNIISGGVDVDVFYNSALSNVLSVRVIGSGEAVGAAIAPTVTTGVTELDTVSGLSVLGHGNSSQWGQAFDWGNHAGLYPLLSGAYANPTWIASLDWLKITNKPAIPTSADYITTNTNQTGLSGNKTFTDAWNHESILWSPLRLKAIDRTSNLSISFFDSTNSGFNIGMCDKDNFAIGSNDTLLPLVNRWFWVNRTGLVSSKGGFNKYGQNDTQILLAGGGHKPVSDFALADNYVRKGASANNALFSNTIDLNNPALGSYFAYLSSGSVNKPISSGGFLTQHYFQSAGVDYVSQDWTSLAGNRFFRRSNTNENFVEFYHTGNLNSAQFVLQSALNTQLANYVPINGVTTINNTKTFTASPVVPNATLDSHAVNLGQLNSALDDNYLPLAGGTMDDGSVINWNIGTSAVIQLGGNNRIRVTFPNTFISSSVSGTTDGIYLRPRGDINATGQVRINGNGQITTHSHGDSSQWHSAYQATQNLSSNYVPINGVTTINNTKTFTSSPVVPNGTLAGHVVNLGQLNSALDGNYEQDILFSTDFNTADVVTLNNPTIFYFTSLVDQLDFQVGSMRKGDELVVHNSNEFAVMININKIRQDGIIGTELSIQPQTTTSFILAYMGGNPYFAVKHRTDIY